MKQQRIRHHPRMQVWPHDACDILSKVVVVVAAISFIRHETLED